MYKDVNYGLPVDTGTRALHYNVAMLEEKGVPVPQTIDDLTAALPELTDADNGVYGITFAGGERWVWLYEALGMLTVPNGHISWPTTCRPALWPSRCCPISSGGSMCTRMGGLHRKT